MEVRRHRVQQRRPSQLPGRGSLGPIQKGAKYLMDDGEPPSLLGTAVINEVCADHAHP